MKFKNIIIFFIICTIFFNFSTAFATEEPAVQKEESGIHIYSEAAILMEEKTGKILYEKNIHDRKYPASTTKILTAILAIENCDLNEMAEASQSSISALKDGYTKANIQVGEKFTIDQLISVMMIQSANEAANVIAEHISGSVPEFAKLMNKKAKEIGCTGTNFVNPSGMHDESHYSTAYDMALIARYCMKNEKFREYVTLKEASLPRTEYWQDEQVEEHGERIFYNTNSMMQKDNKFYYPTCIGIKAGFTTPAKNCLVSASNKDGFEVITVILHAESTEDEKSARYVDTINLFNYAYENYKLSDILEEYDMLDEEKQVDAVVAKTNEADNSFIEMKETPNINIIKIIVGSICVLIGIIIFWKRSRKQENLNEIYKFNL